MFDPANHDQERQRICRDDSSWAASYASAWLGLVLAIAFGGRAVAADIRFELPVDCAMGSVCTIMKYFDHDPSPERVDYACGRKSLDGDTGTDFRVPDYVTMERGVAVVAAAPGVVKSVRDGMADVNVRLIGQPALAGKFAGNGVVIDHGDGWATQYSHLKKGSIAVHAGERVAAGQRLGLIGLSGNTEFPHVEFGVRHQGRPVDPFVGLVPFPTCEAPRAPLWSDAAAAQLAYRPSGPLIAGFATQRPDAEAARWGRYRADRIPANAAALVFWADIYGALRGDRQRIRIEAPDGRTLHEAETVLDDNNLSWFAFSGRPRPAGGWPPGRYRGTYTLMRDGVEVMTTTATVIVGD